MTQTTRTNHCLLLAITLIAAACGQSTGSENPEPDAGQSGPDSGSNSVDCGDGVRDLNEACDDGNLASGDGCDDQCAVETDHACPVPGQSCVLVVECGNGRIEGSETCDDSNTSGGDGCSDVCLREDGWNCSTAGIACVASSCGDGIVAGFEICDDGNTSTEDGCDASCNLEEGFHCPVQGQACESTDCGDGLVQGTEECDDQNAIVGDGCNPLCKREPQCQNGVCDPVCGDAVLQVGEGCDDGNTLSGDGCDANCSIEVGFACEEMPLPDPSSVEIPVTVRDFVAACGTGSRLADDQGGTAPYGHRDFECFNGGVTTGMVASDLDLDKKPVRVQNDSTFSDASFAQWYRSDDNYNRSVARVLTLPATTSGPSGTYQLDSDSLYPVNSDGFTVEDCNGSPCEQTHADGNGAGQSNFHFTTEVRFWFEYAGNEVLAFSGDDDVWVFINNKLAVDIGGVHGRADGSVDLSDTSVATDLGLTVGGTYEAVVFHAERHTTRSQYRLTLANFNKEPSVCSDVCGDDVVSSREVCDDGANNGNGDGSAYGGCAADCTLEPHCGDGVVDAEFGEICDDGLNLGGEASECAPGCRSLGAFCGDGVVQTNQGEQCDDGGNEGGDGCTDDCKVEIE